METRWIETAEKLRGKQHDTVTQSPRAIRLFLVINHCFTNAHKNIYFNCFYLAHVNVIFFSQFFKTDF